MNVVHTLEKQRHMKSLLVCMMIGICYAVSAQSEAQLKGDTTTQAPYENKDDILYRKQDEMVAIAAGDIPPELRSTLKHSRYQGWEQGSLMRSDDGKVYELRLNRGKKIKIHRFDAQGKAIDN